MNRNRLTSTLSTLVIILFVASGCKKVVHQNIQAASNSSVAIIAFNDVFEQINAAVDSSLDAKTNSTWFLNGSLCVTASLSPVGATFPKTLTIDYGTGCVGANGKSRSGKIIAVFDGNFEDENTSVNVSFDAFTTGQYALAGKDSITNLGTDGNGNPLFTETLRDVVISWGTQQILWNADLNRAWTEGDATNYLTAATPGTLGMDGLNDDVFELTGSATGNDSNTHPFALQTTSPLTLQTGCSYITEGTLTISPANFNDGTVDYGNGECNKQATIEVDGEVFNFTM